ncbi:nuclear factor 7, brain-like [Trichomycterus rosablanca]|uniref:nuclear factor 7, brain-like n=1 Tax=Trichomycterus rosablanca TaxID=2290929 RepID=UPI002F3546A7
MPQPVYQGRHPSQPSFEKHSKCSKRTSEGTPSFKRQDNVCTYQKMICVICKEEQRHRGHVFKTLEDAFKAKKEKTSETLRTLSREEEQLVTLFNSQAEEISKTREKSSLLSNQIFVQFEQLHQFLRDKEAEVKKMLTDEEDEILAVMEVNVFTIEEMLSDVREKRGILMSAQETNTKACEFLQWWNEDGLSVIRNTNTPDTLEASLQDISVKLDSLFLGPYETYLQFFVWKQMLRSIQTVPHRDTVINGGDQRVSPSGLYIQPKIPGKIIKHQINPSWLRTDTSFTTGQQYWEVDLTGKLEWGVGICSCNLGKFIKDTVLCLSPVSGYDIQQSHDADKRTVQNEPGLKKVGVYLNCERKQVSFYNADTMTLIDIRVLSQPGPYALCLSPGLYLNGFNMDPLRVCVF